MDYTKSNMLSIDLNEIYEAELYNLVQENEALRVQNETLKLQLITKDKQRKVLQEEFKQLKKTYENIGDSMVLCSVNALSKGLDMVKIKHVSEIEEVCGELSKSKLKVENITATILRERRLRIHAEADKQEAIAIAEELFGIIEQLQKNILKSTLNTQALKPSQPVLRGRVMPKDIVEAQKTPKKENPLESLYYTMEELRDVSELKKHISTIVSSTSSLRGQTIQSQRQSRAELRTEARDIHKDRVTSPKDCTFFTRYI